MPHRGGVIDPDEGSACSARCRVRDLPAAASSGAWSLLRTWQQRRATPARCRSRMSIPCRSACSRRLAPTAARHREGQSAGNYQSYGGPHHYGFIAARAGFIRRMPRRIVGETTDLRGERGYVLTLQTREQHIRREGDLEHHDEPDAVGARRPRAPVPLARPAGHARAGGDLHEPRVCGRRKLGLPLVFPGRQRSRSCSARRDGARRTSSARAESMAFIPATHSGGTTSASTTRCLWR